jgi:hypothetical protein
MRGGEYSREEDVVSQRFRCRLSLLYQPWKEHSPQSRNICALSDVWLSDRTWTEACHRGGRAVARRGRGTIYCSQWAAAEKLWVLSFQLGTLTLTSTLFCRCGFIVQAA